MRRGRPPHPELLTPREQEVLDLLRQGLSNRQIGERLGISYNGARYHVAEILSKLGVSTREEAAAWQGDVAPTRRRWFGFVPVPGLFGRLTPEALLRSGSVLLIGAGIAAFALLLAGMLVFSARRDEKPRASITPEAATPEAAPPAAETERIVTAAGNVEPLVLAPAAVQQDGLIWARVIYDLDQGSVLSQDSPEYLEARAATERPPLSYLDDGTLIVLIGDEWHMLDNNGGRTPFAFSENGRMAAFESPSGVTLLDLAALTRRDVDIRAMPLGFSPDGSKVLLRLREEHGGSSPYIVIPLSDPLAAVRLPPGAGPTSIAQGRPMWLDNERVIAVSQKAFLLQVYDVGGSQPTILLEQTITGEQVVPSPDGALLAVGVGFNERVDIYRLAPFGIVASLPGASLGQQLLVPREVWSTDGRRLLLVQDMCGQTERLISFDIATAAERELVRGEFMRWTYSPDGRWVAYTAWSRLGFVMAADGTGSPIAVMGEVNALAEPLWSANARVVSFLEFYGGYDRCLR